MLAFCDNTNEALTGTLRAGNAGSNTAAADHLTVGDAALRQISDDYRYRYPIGIRSDGAGSSQALLAHIGGLEETLVAMPLTYASWCQYFDHGIPGVEHAAVAGLFSVEAVATAAFLHAWVAAAAAAGVEPLADLGEGFAQCAS